MKITVKGYLSLRDRLGSQTPYELQEHSTLRDLLETLPPEVLEAVEPERQPIESRRQGSIAILINGHPYTHLPDRLDTPLQDGDEVAIFPPLAGGSF